MNWRLLSYESMKLLKALKILTYDNNLLAMIVARTLHLLDIPFRVADRKVHRVPRNTESSTDTRALVLQKSIQRRGSSRSLTQKRRKIRNVKMSLSRSEMWL